jgi:4,5-DOPA dioxygenase extradiol
LKNSAMHTWPSLFVSHGAPTFAIEPGLAGAQLEALGRSLGKPRAIVVISPHWMTRELEITASEYPQTLHDFGGFPRELYRLQYPAPGSPDTAAQIQKLLNSRGIPSRLDARRGLDHGAWVPLLHLYPEADVPVLQVSMPLSSDAASAYALGRALAPLAEQGMLIVGSGSLTHNLYEFRAGHMPVAQYAKEFCMWVRQTVVEGDTHRLLQTMALAPHAARAHPTTEHFLPLLVAAGASSAPAVTTVLDGGIRHGVLAMESYLLGQHVVIQPEVPS